MYEEIRSQAEAAAAELVETARLSRGSLFVVGCSSSEMIGDTIGKNSNIDAAKAAFEGIYGVLSKKGIYLCAQCCEHLNRAIIMEREAAEKYGYDIVNVMPQPKAGGSFATTAWNNFNEPVAVENVKADAGMDIGATLIGMHLKPVAVPVRLKVKSIGRAVLICARTRPKFIGGNRAVYVEELK